MAVSVETVINNVARTLLDTAFRTWSRAEHVANLNVAQRLICGDYKLDAYPKREFVALVAGIAQDIPAEGTALIDITDNEVSQRSVTQTDLAILQEENRFWPRGTQQTEVENYAADPRTPRKFYVFPPNNGVARILALGQEVGEAYTNTITEVLAHPDLREWEYILTVEHDNVPPPDGVIRLIAAMDKHPEYACIGGLYYTKGEGGVAQIWGDPTDPVLNFRPLPPKAGEVVECCGTGMGFNLWRLSMFKDERLRRPWFKTLAGREGVGTQDLYFWGDARKHGYRGAIDCDVLVGHYSPAEDIVW